MTETVKLALINLPCSIKGFTLKMNDVYTIVLNARLSRETNQQSLEHELKHITEGHLDREINVQEVECELHGVGKEWNM